MRNHKAEKVPTARPVAFRVPRVVDDKISKTEFRLFDDEEEARRAACDIGADYDGLYLVADRRAAFFAQPDPRLLTVAQTVWMPIATAPKGPTISVARKGGQRDDGSTYWYQAIGHYDPNLGHFHKSYGELYGEPEVWAQYPENPERCAARGEIADTRAHAGSSAEQHEEATLQICFDKVAKERDQLRAQIKELSKSTERYMRAVAALGKDSGYNKLTYFEAPILNMPTEEMKTEAHNRWLELNDAGIALTLALQPEGGK